MAMNITTSVPRKAKKCCLSSGCLYTCFNLVLILIVRINRNRSIKSIFITNRVKIFFKEVFWAGLSTAVHLNRQLIF